MQHKIAKPQHNLMKKIISSLFTLAAVSVISIQAQGQVSVNTLAGRQNVVTTAVPFLTITPDARSGAMADAGVAVTPDANAMYWNPSKLAFEPNDMGFSYTYTPWLRALVPDISLQYLSGYKRIDKLSGVGASLKYFSLGDINFTDNFGNAIKTYRPYEFALDLGYARKLADNFSIGIAGRYVYSNLAGQITLNNGGTTKAGKTFAGDISAYYTTKIKLGKTKADLAFGGNISNIGGKMTYTDLANRDFIPINLRLGGYLNMHLNEYNDLAFALDFNKLLVPTPPVYQKDSLGNVVKNPDGTGKVQYGQDPNVPVIQGMIQSFYDAPGGFSEELHEINPSIGMEYWYAHQFAGRIGYFYEHPTKGGRQYLTVGVGIKYSIMELDFSYLVPTNGSKTLTRSPLDNTLRFTLMFAIDTHKHANEKP